MRSPEVVAALAHEHRLAVYRMLVEAGAEGLPAGGIAARLKLPPSSLTFHLPSLQRAGLISQQRMSRQLFPALFAAEPAVVKNDYAKSEKSWIADPQGIQWETFVTTGESTVYGGDQPSAATPSACCEPASIAPSDPVRKCCA